MKISELILLLEALKNEHGDLDVETYGYDGSRIPLNAPRIDHQAILKGREHKERFATALYGDAHESRKGTKVCRL